MRHFTPIRALVTATMVMTLAPAQPVAAAVAMRSTFGVEGHPMKFRADVTDYVIYDCAGKKATLTLAGVGRTDKVNGRPVVPGKSGKAKVTKNMKADEILTVYLASRKKTYYVRCLPDDFPRLELVTKQPGLLTKGYYLMPYYSRALEGQNFSSRYYIITDHRGTPVWYRRASGGSTVLAADGGGRLITQGVLDGMSPGAAHPGNSVKIVMLDGSTILDVKPQDSLVRPAWRTPEGGLLMLSAPIRRGVDFSKLSTKFKDNSKGVCPMSRQDVTVQGLGITELNADGSVAWQADLTDQIGFEEPTQASVVNNALPGEEPNCSLDLFHQNHVTKTEDGSGYIVSLRWAGVYYVDKATSTVRWKLGGSPTDRSLKVQGDPLGTAGPVAQHGGVLTGDGRLLVFDNQLQKNVLPRAVEYFVDPASMTAAHLRSFALDASFCVVNDGALSCPASSQGDAAYLPDGNVLVSWGNTDGRSHLATVFAPDGTEIASMFSRSGKPNVFTMYHAPISSFNLKDLRRFASSTETIDNGTYGR